MPRRTIGATSNLDHRRRVGCFGKTDRSTRPSSLLASLAKPPGISRTDFPPPRTAAGRAGSITCSSLLPARPRALPSQKRFAKRLKGAPTPARRQNGGMAPGRLRRRRTLIGRAATVADFPFAPGDGRRRGMAAFCSALTLCWRSVSAQCAPTAVAGFGNGRRCCSPSIRKPAGRGAAGQTGKRLQASSSRGAGFRGGAGSARFP